MPNPSAEADKEKIFSYINNYLFQPWFVTFSRHPMKTDKLKSFEADPRQDILLKTACFYQPLLIPDISETAQTEPDEFDRKIPRKGPQVRTQPFT